MAKKRMGKIGISLMVALLMALSACSGSTNTTTAANGTAKTQADTSAGESSADSANQDPITLTVGIQAANCSLDGINQDYTVLQKITEETGVTLSFVSYDKDKYTVLVAGNDLPDIINTYGDDAANLSAMKSGQFLALDDLLDQYGQTIEEHIPLALKWSKEVYGSGTTYIMPTNVQISDESNPENVDECTFNARYDIYKAIGSPEITDDDSFLNVLKQMQDYAREQSGTDDIYALSAWTDWGTWPYMIDYPFANGYMNTNYNQLISPDGDLVSAFTEADGVFWQGLQFFNKAYQMGIFDPEGLTQKFDQYTNKVITGKVLTLFLAGRDLDTDTLGEDAVMTILPGSVEYIPAVYNTESPLGYNASNARAINANCKYPERAMQFLNWCEETDNARLLTNGVQGTEWDVIDGEPQLIGDYKQAVLDGTVTEYGNTHLTGLTGTNFANLGRYLTSGQFTTEDGYPIDLSTTKSIKEESASSAVKKFAQDYGSDLYYRGEVYDQWIKEGKAKTLTSYNIAANLIATPSDETVTTTSKAQEYFMANVSKVILASSDEEFATEKANMLQAFEDMGMDVADKEIQDLFAQAQTVAQDYTD